VTGAAPDPPAVNRHRVEADENATPEVRRRDATPTAARSATAAARGDGAVEEENSMSVLDCAPSITSADDASWHPAAELSARRDALPDRTALPLAEQRGEPDLRLADSPHRAPPVPERTPHLHRQRSLAAAPPLSRDIERAVAAATAVSNAAPENWPALPDALADDFESDDSTRRQREMEHLRRLASEQRGWAWNE
jgi:hypothetical protein